jgi:hypothetical protein
VTTSPICHYVHRSRYHLHHHQPLLLLAFNRNRVNNLVVVVVAMISSTALACTILLHSCHLQQQQQQQLTIPTTGGGCFKCWCTSATLVPPASREVGNTRQHIPSRDRNQPVCRRKKKQAANSMMTTSSTSATKSALTRTLSRGSHVHGVVGCWGGGGLTTTPRSSPKSRAPLHFLGSVNSKC